MDEPAGDEIAILVVEDNPGDIRLVEEAVQETDSTLHVVRDGKEALDFLHQRNDFTDVSLPDIVLLDLNLPKVDGTRVLEEIRRNPALNQIRIIILTSAQAEHADVDPEKIGEDDFLTKPADPDEFIALVRSRIVD